MLALVRCLSGGCPVQQVQQAVACCRSCLPPPSAVLYFLPADSSWAQEWPFQFEALYTVCLMEPEPPTISDTGGSQWPHNGHTMGAQGLYTQLEGALFEALCCSQSAG